MPAAMHKVYQIFISAGAPPQTLPLQTPPGRPHSWI